MYLNQIRLDDDTSTDDDAPGDPTTKQIRTNLHMALLQNTHSCEVWSVDDDEYVVAAVAFGMKPITWEDIARETIKDKNLTDAIDILKGKVPNMDISQETQDLISLGNDLQEDGGILTFRGRPIVPAQMRDQVISTLHSAHQGVSRMTSRAEESVYWPGLSLDIRQARVKCRSCDENAPSQPSLPPTEPIVPVYLFQHLSADHLDYAGNMFGIIVDRFSNWLKIYRGNGGAATFVKVMRDMCESFNIPETVTTDGGPQYVAAETQRFFRQFGIQHRLTSVANPHANSCAEIGVKSAKRILRENVGFNGSVDNAAITRAIMMHRNTPDPDTGLSPAELLIGRTLRDFLPNKSYGDPLSSSANLDAKWKRIAEWREEALAKRSARDEAKWMKGTKDLSPLIVGQRVAIQNQSGNHPKKWNKRGTVIDVLPFHQYRIKVDGFNRITLRNRKFVRPCVNINKERKTNDKSTSVPTASVGSSVSLHCSSVSLHGSSASSDQGPPLPQGFSALPAYGSSAGH